MLEDLELAKKKLHEKSLTLVVIKDSKVLFESKAHGVYAFLEALDKFGGKMRGTSVADKVVGKAIALLCIYARVRAVYASTISIKAKQAFENYGIYFEWGELVEKILDASGKNVCPFEKAAMKIDDPKKAYGKLKALLNSLKSKHK
ncbi:MAG: DUF1893 domain-containing protein [Candidatus Bathyarchaeia archaeon]